MGIDGGCFLACLLWQGSCNIDENSPERFLKNEMCGRQDGFLSRV